MDTSPDCSIIPIPGTRRNIVSSIDFFYPTVKNPYLQGRIACCNVLSDLYAQGITKISTLLMVLGVSRQMEPLESEIVTKLMIQGFQDTAEEAQTSITGGQSVWNPWPMIGGVGIACPSELEMIESTGAKPGDLLILTKPLGCQVIVNVNQWLEDFPDKWQKVQVDANIIRQSIQKAEKSMGRLNLPEAKLMIELNAHCATDVTGFGIKGHATNLVKVQKESVDFIIDNLPVFKGVLQSEGKVRKFNIKEGSSPETSGGLLISLDQDKAKIFLQKMKAQGLDTWIVGKVVQGNHKVIFNNVQFNEI